MFEEYIFTILCCCLLSSKCQHLKKTVCEKGVSCYYLYEAGTSRLTWKGSLEACTKEGLEIVRIESSQTQKVIESLLQDLPEATQRQIWIGGRRSAENKRRYMNGTEFHKDVEREDSKNSNDMEKYCLYVTLCNNTDNPNYHADNCDEKNSPSRLLCQSVQRKKDISSSTDSYFIYTKTEYNGEKKIDWYNGQTYCSKSDISGDIAYSYSDNNTQINEIINLVDDSKDCVQLWFGVRKRIWFWMTASNNDQDKQPINYFNWDNNTKIDSSDHDCIYINRTNGNKWFTQSCNGPPLKYFICMNDSSGTTTTTTPSTEAATETATSNMKDRDSQLGAIKNKSFNIVYIVPIVVVIVIALVIGLAVFFVIKKRKKSNDEQKYVNEEFHHPSSKPVKNDDPECADDQHDMIDPYSVTGDKNTRNADVGHKVAPSGDLYAVSTKQTTKIDDDINKNKDGINPEELYAKPNKKRNQKSKMVKVNEENQATNSRNDVDTESPSSDEKSSASKHTEHFEAESGDVYAKVTK